MINNEFYDSRIELFPRCFKGDCGESLSFYNDKPCRSKRVDLNGPSAAEDGKAAMGMASDLLKRVRSGALVWPGYGVA